MPMPLSPLPLFSCQRVISMPFYGAASAERRRFHYAAVSPFIFIFTPPRLFS
jgi:hypothetical protein